MIYLIQRIGFDNLENHDPWVVSIEGYFLDKTKANEYIRDKLASIKPYKGWDGQTYPRFTITEVEEIK